MLIRELYAEIFANSVFINDFPLGGGHPCCSAVYFVVAYAYSGLSPVRARPWRANTKKTTT